MKSHLNAAYEQELMTLLGILGALDPDVYRQGLLGQKKVQIPTTPTYTMIYDLVIFPLCR